MKGAAAALAITILMVGPLFSQVHIKENAIITPAEPKRSQDGATSSHDIRFEFYWDHPMWAGVYFTSWCSELDSTVSSDASPIIIDLPATSTYYNFYPRLDMSYGQGPVTHVSYKFYANNLLVRSDSADLAPNAICCGTWWWPTDPMNGMFWTSYYSGFSFSLGASELVCGDSTGMSLIGNSLDCTPPLWSPHTDQVTLSITTGSQYLSFHEIDPQTGEDIALGAKATTTGDNLGRYFLVADGITPDPAGSAAVIQAESNGTVRTQSILVYPGFDHFHVWTDPDTIVHSNFSNIYVQAKDVSDNDVVIPDDEPLHITADDSGKYGEIEEWWSTHLLYSYGDANTGGIDYNADQSEPEGVQKISIKVVDANAPKKTGSGDLFLEGDIVVEVVPPEISPGDTALVIVKQRNSDGSLSDFSADQQFEIGISSGMDYGTLLMSDGSTGGYFANASQPFRFIAADSINADSVMVGIRAGWQQPAASSIVPGGKGSPGHSMRSKQTTITARIESSGLKSSASKVNTTTKGRKSVTDASSFTLSDYGTGSVVIKKKNCDEVIEECQGPDLQPQTFSDANVQLVSSGMKFRWTNKAGQTVETPLDFCKHPNPFFDPITKDTLAQYGNTAMPPTIPPYPEPGEECYQVASDIAVKTCLDPSAGKWRFKVDKLKIPVAMSICYPDGYSDLVDGLATYILEEKIPNYDIYQKVLHDLDAVFIPGTYVSTVRPYLPYFYSVGTIAHEEYHYSKDIEALTESFNTGFQNIFESESLDKSAFPCPKDAIGSAESNIRNDVKNAFLRAERKRTGVSEETKADEAAGFTYGTIRERIHAWARTQPWYPWYLGD